MSLCIGWRRAAIAAGAVLTVLGAVSAPALTQGQPSGVSKLEPGLWQLRDLDDGRHALAPMCVADPSVLFQVEHRNTTCSRRVIASDGQGATVHYTCPAIGFGRTSIRVETPRLARIDTQGISGKAPFAYRLEARQTGRCEGNGTRAGR